MPIFLQLARSIAPHLGWPILSRLHRERVGSGLATSTESPAVSNRHPAILILALFLLAPGLAAIAQTPTNAIPSPQMPQIAGTELDRIVAIVNGQIILDSDVEQERRFLAIEPFHATRAFSRDKAIETLVNRDLILQQTQIQTMDDPDPDQIDKEIGEMRKNLPACREYHCDTQAGYVNFLAANGLTEAEVRTHVTERIKTLAFIEQRFRMGVKVTPDKVKTYYQQTLLPQYAARNAKAPPLDSIAEPIQQVLLEQQVTSLLGEWLKSLRAQGSVVILHPGEEAP